MKWLCFVFGLMSLSAEAGFPFKVGNCLTWTQSQSKFLELDHEPTSLEYQEDQKFRVYRGRGILDPQGVTGIRCSQSNGSESFTIVLQALGTKLWKGEWVDSIDQRVMNVLIYSDRTDFKPLPGYRKIDSKAFSYQLKFRFYHDRYLKGVIEKRLNQIIASFSGFFEKESLDYLKQTLWIHNTLDPQDASELVRAYLDSTSERKIYPPAPQELREKILSIQERLHPVDFDAFLYQVATVILEYRNHVYKNLAADLLQQYEINMHHALERLGNHLEDFDPSPDVKMSQAGTKKGDKKQVYSFSF